MKCGGARSVTFAYLHRRLKGKRSITCKVCLSLVQLEPATAAARASTFVLEAIWHAGAILAARFGALLCCQDEQAIYKAYKEEEEEEDG